VDVDWEADRVMLGDEDGRLLIDGEPAEVADGLDDSNEDTDAEVDTVLVNEGESEANCEVGKDEDADETLGIAVSVGLPEAEELMVSDEVTLMVGEPDKLMVGEDDRLMVGELDRLMVGELDKLMVGV
jgi:hypothetical protein